MAAVGLRVCSALSMQARVHVNHNQPCHLRTGSASGLRAADTDATCTLQAIRAPLVVAVLQAYSSMTLMALQQELRVIYPHLTRLICCGQPAVRKAVASLLNDHLPALLPV